MTARLLPSRDALADLKPIPCRLAAEGSGAGVPLVTIGIPTYRRGDLLVAAVRSALDQTFDTPYEIIITGNDPDSQVAENLLAQLPELRRRHFRYYVNSSNIGGYANHNRCIEQARAPWITILNDDDLLKPDFLAVTFRHLRDHPEVNGLVGAKETFDERIARPVTADAPDAGTKFRRVARKALMIALYRGGFSRRITPRKLFWGPLTGNVCGFVFRKDCAVAIGGFYPEEDPNSDYWFYTRFAQRFQLRQHQHVVASIRVAVNGSANPDLIEQMFVRTHEFRRVLADHEVPRWWQRLSPYLIARSRVELNSFWNVAIPTDRVGRAIGTTLPKDRPYLVWTLKFLLRGF